MIKNLRLLLSFLLSLVLLLSLCMIPVFSDEIPETAAEQIEMPMPEEDETAETDSITCEESSEEERLPETEETEVPPEEPFDWLQLETGRKINKMEEDPELVLSIDEDTFLIYARFFRDEMGLNNAAIAGIMANMQQESGFNPNKIGDMGFAYGLLQWRGPRLDALVEFCAEEDLSPISVEGQLQFMKKELTESYIYCYDLLKDTPEMEYGALTAAYYFCQHYEAPSDIDKIIPIREKLASKLIFPTLYELEDAGLF